MSDKKGWGIIGTGRRAARVMIPALVESSTSRIAGVAGSSEERARQSLPDSESFKVYSSIEEMMEDPEVEIVYIATPHFLHVPHAVQAIEAGKHVFMEPPMSLSVDGAHKLVEKARSMQVKLGVAFQHRFHEGIRKLRDQLGSPEEILHLAVTLFHHEDLSKGWWADSFRSGPAALLRLGIHAVDLACWLKKSAPVEVTAAGRFLPDSGLNTQVGAVLKFEDQTLAVISAATDLDEHNQVSAVQKNNSRITVTGDFSAGPIVIVVKRDGEESSEQLTSGNPVVRMIDSFVNAVEGKEDFSPSGWEGKVSVQAACALIESMKNKKTVRVGEISRIT